MDKKILFFSGICLVGIYIVSTLLVISNPLLFLADGEGYIPLMGCLIKNVYLLMLLTAILVIGIKLTKAGYVGIVNSQNNDEK